MSGAVVIGVGPGIGQAVARRFAAQGLRIGLIARKETTVAAAAAGLEGAVTATADVADEGALRAALDKVTAELGTPDAVIYNAAVIRPDGPGELSAREHLDAYAVNVVGALTAAAHLAPAMVEGGSFLITGGMPDPVPGYISLSLGKAGVRTLVELLHQHYGEHGLHVASVTVGGAVAPGTAYDPDDIAEHYWRLHTEPREQWRREVRHG
ncbi:MAG: SDR family NAD(P)-dependent oxidoreductase [Nonomuraea sp.]|nr:SDR family NAD(P)-dependent oxidoreductase [Nonomuraea sp.]